MFDLYYDREIKDIDDRLAPWVKLDQLLAGGSAVG
jgi:hypothetical protein